MQRRFIPTPVGNTLVIGWEPILKPVHPHACGEHLGILNTRGGCPGSSPRLWGTPDLVPSKDFLLRFIPTPVGNTMARF